MSKTTKETKTETIERIALAMGKKKQDLANWRFYNKVPATLHFRIYLKAKEEGVILSEKDFNNFG